MSTAVSFQLNQTHLVFTRTLEGKWWLRKLHFKQFYLYLYLYGDVLKSCLVSYCIVSLVSVGRLLGHLLWLTGKCVQLNWSSILLDGYKRRSLPRQPSREDLLVRRPKSVKTLDSTVRLHQAGIEVSLFIYLLSYCLFHFCFSFYNQFLLCVSCSLLACVFGSVLFLGLLINYCRLICYLF